MAAARAEGRPRRYAQVGLGARSWLYSFALGDRARGRGELVGLCDRNAGRLEQRMQWARANGFAPAGCGPEGFEAMLRDAAVDEVIVATDDRHHDAYIAPALEAGCDVVTEKPLTIDDERLARVLEVRARTGRRLRVAFNYRYAPARAQVKELLASGAIGEVVSVAFEWLLDTQHGADYFRRWHRRKENSGGLLVHKATHHFDLVNWWLDTTPVAVRASGARRFYVPATAARLGLERAGPRCLGCAEAHRCPFHLDLEARKELAAIYLAHEAHDGYWRDRCVFDPEIDIEDAMSAVVEYASGAQLAYSLHAFAPYEGYRVAFNGTRGRLEHRARETSYVSGDGAVPGLFVKEETAIELFPQRGEPREIPVVAGEGGHGGGDARLIEDLFDPAPPPDPLGRAADHAAGAWSVVVGVAANRSIATGETVSIASLRSAVWLDASAAGRDGRL
jgi:predicted dehydrogenase